MTNIITCDDVSKQFRLPQVEHHTLRGRILHPLSRPTWREFDALDNVSFDVQKGEFFGIIGRNGSGKSTLLKIIAGIYRPTTGRVSVDGSLASFIELGVGFNPDLSGHDNLLINGALLGLSRRQILYRMDEIVDFAELDGFMDMKLRNFSSGMQVRLAFSIALQADVDVLLTDEVLAVGDARFQEKCFEVFRERKAKGRTIVFVSHDMSAVQQFCDRAMLLNQGRVVDIGDTHQIARNYLQVNSIDNERSAAALVVDDSDGQCAEIDSAWLENLDGDEIHEAAHGEAIRVCVKVRSRERAARVAIGMYVQDPLGQYLFMTNSQIVGCEIEPLDRGDEITFVFEFVNYLASGHYKLGCGVTAVMPDGTTGPIVDARDGFWQYRSTAPKTSHGVVDLPVSGSVRAAGPLELRH